MRIVVLVKPVPDPAAGSERLGADFRLDRAASPAVVNANDEYALEAALKLVEEHGGEVTVLSMAGSAAPETIRKALAMGAAAGMHVADASLAGSDVVSTTRVLAAALRGLEADLIFAGADTSDGGAGLVPAGVAALLRLPYLSYAAKIEPDPSAGRVKVHRISATGFDVLEAPMPAVIACTQALGAPRYPSLKGIMAARSKSVENASFDGIRAAVGDAAIGGEASATTVVAAEPPPPRAATRVIREAPDEAARQVVAFLAERRII
ncbi:MAG TPA: electron transfer flavoprotein subunit beta/FixA family protein [Candidatus Limnocylindrales bacterium]|nr:electron transfer flavoprotein subunit beta/FixA family protein [Candidatus Limnocylindrales bacterium]